MSKQMIPLSVPNLAGNEWKYVKECLDTGWISSAGKFVNQFEDMVADYAGAKHGVAVVNGTAGLHIALNLVGVQPGDYVIVSNITFVASANAIKYTGATPILIDADPDSWQLDLKLLEKFLSENTRLNDKGECVLISDNKVIRAVMPVHIQGNICDMTELDRICTAYGVQYVEDSAEALGSTYNGKSAGTFGKLGVFSFNGNKIISTGGGGVIVTDDESLAVKAKHITTTAKTNSLTYFHDEVGYNYRLVNILAAIGVAQMEVLPDFVKKKQAIGNYYSSNLLGVADIGFQKVAENVSHNNWLFTIQSLHRDKILEHLNSNKIISRPFWMPMNQLPMYRDCHYITENDNCKHIHDTCMAIPCSTNITEGEMNLVIEEIKKAVS